MFITIDKEDVKSTIKRYYEEVEGDRVDVRFYTYDADYSYQANGVTIYANRNEAINGIRFESEDIISDDELCEIFKHFIGEKYDVKSVIRNVGYVTSGYGMSETTELDLTSLKLEVNKKEKVKNYSRK